MNLYSSKQITLLPMFSTSVQCHDQSCTLFLKLDIEIICISLLTHPYIQPFTEPSDIAFSYNTSHIHSYHIDSSNFSCFFWKQFLIYTLPRSVFSKYHYNYVPKINLSFPFLFLLKNLQCSLILKRTHNAHFPLMHSTSHLSIKMPCFPTIVYLYQWFLLSKNFLPCCFVLIVPPYSAIKSSQGIMPFLSSIFWLSPVLGLYIIYQHLCSYLTIYGFSSRYT